MPQKQFSLPIHDYYTPSEAAKVLRVTPWTIRQRVRRGRIPHRKEGQFILIPRAYLYPETTAKKGAGDEHPYAVKA